MNKTLLDTDIFSVMSKGMNPNEGEWMNSARSPSTDRPGLPPPGYNGLRPTLRQMMILVGFSGLLSAFLAVYPPGSHPVGYACLVVIFAPLGLGLLLLIFDRPGPVRRWLVLACFQAFAALEGAGLTYLGVAVTRDIVFRVEILLATVLIGVLDLLAWIILFRLCPLRCPRCRRRSRIAQSPRRLGPRRRLPCWWCASCRQSLVISEGRWLVLLRP